MAQSFTTRAVRYHENTDDFHNFVIEDVTLPELQPGQVVVKVACAAINPVDDKVMKGYLKGMWAMPLPFTMGYDLSGTVAAVGPEVTDLAVGDAVFGVNWGNQHEGAPGNGHDDAGEPPVGGAFAQYAVIKASKLSKKPAELGFDVAAAIPLVGTTAYDCLDEVGVTEGSRVLILGGSGAVGAVGVQLAKIRGAHVTTTCSGRTLEYVSSLGADKIVDYTQANWWEDEELQGIDAVFDSIGEKEGFEHAKLILKEDGKFISIANSAAGMDPSAHPPLTYAAFHVLSNNAVTQDTLAQLILEGRLSVKINSTFPFTQEGVTAMLEEQVGGKSMGKNVLIVDEELASA